MSRCTWCGKAIKKNVLIKFDASRSRHHFHLECWEKHIEWLMEATKRKAECQIQNSRALSAS